MNKILTGEKGFYEFASRVNLSESETELRKKELDESYMPFAVSDYFTNLCQSLEGTARDQMINIVLPPIINKPFIGRFDPYGNTRYRKDDLSFIQHKYKKTLLFHLSNHCFSSCQFCYKVREIRSDKDTTVQYLRKVDEVIKYIKNHPEVDDVLITGGDPMVLEPKLLIQCLKPIIQQPTIRFIRLATKALAFMPNRFLDEVLLDFFSECNQEKQVTIVAHISHYAEFSTECESAISQIQKTKTQIRSQPVLARSINDTSESLVKLHRKIMDNRIICYYLSLFMPLKGVEQYAIPIHEAYGIVAEAKAQLTGIEKRSMFILSHDFGKIEVCGFSPTYQNPQKIVLRWHQLVDKSYLPNMFLDEPYIGLDQLMTLDYEKGMYSLDDVFKKNFQFT